jgi:hypothetical protein
MKTILPKKTIVEQPMAIDDDAQTQLMMDPSVPQFGSSNVMQLPTNSSATFGLSSSGGFGSVNTSSGTTFNQNIGQQILQPQQQLDLTAAGSNAAQDAEILVQNDNNDWINRRWRPAMGWMYMVVCIFDFILFPIMYTMVQFWEIQASNDAFRQWQPVTLMGAGLFHMAMGAVLGIAAYGRTKEKLEGKQQ